MACTGNSKRILLSWQKRGAATLIYNADNFVKDIYREHNHEADLWADIGSLAKKFLVHGFQSMV